LGRGQVRDIRCEGRLSFFFLSQKGINMRKSTHPLCVAARGDTLKRANALALALRGRNVKKARNRKGILLNEKAFANTYRAVRSDGENFDRYRRKEERPDMSCEIAIMLDISGSMDDKRDGRRGNPTIMEEALAAAIILAELAQKLRIPLHVNGVDVEHYDPNTWGDHPSKGATHPYRAVLYPFTTGGGKLAVEADKLMRFSPRGGTYIASYAETAVASLTHSTAKHKLAVYMTDGACSSVAYLPSIQQMAEAKGITLVGVVMGHQAMASEARNHPNGVFCPTASQFGSVVINHIISLVKG
jgi:hypothetical protein